VLNSMAVIFIVTSARIVQASLSLYDSLPSVMHNPLEVTSQYDPPETIDQLVPDGDAPRGPQSAQSVPIVQSANTAPGPPSLQYPSEA